MFCLFISFFRKHCLCDKLKLQVYVYMYIYIYIYVCVYVYVYIHIIISSLSVVSLRHAALAITRAR